MIRAFLYLSQYRLDVQHKSKKQYIVFDAFSRLFFNVDVDKKISNSNLNEFENILDIIYYVTLIKMFDDFKSRLKKIYRINKRWVKILKLIKLKTFLSIVTNMSIVKNSFTNIISIARQFFISSLSTNSLFVATKSIVFEKSWFEFMNLRFRYRDDLIYYVNDLNDERERFCIFKSFIDEIFALAYDRLSHVDYYKIYDKIVTFFFIRKLSKKLQIYVTHCSQC